jgi:DNA integrity scanning protein DisA with diadenylate cyclase activity
MACGRKPMDSSVLQEVAETSLSEPAELKGLAEKKTAQVVNSKIGTDAERIRSSISKLTSNSVDELEKLISKLQELQEFLKSETSRVQGEIGNVLDGVGIIIEALAPWKTDGAASTRTTGRDKLKRWP